LEIEEMHGSDRVPDLNIDYERAGLAEQSNGFNESEMALFSERMLKCGARKLLDTADIVREAILRLAAVSRVCRAGTRIAQPL
jgi:hypothetical protein